MAPLMYTPTTEDGELFILTTQFLPFKDSLGKDTLLGYSTDFFFFKYPTSFIAQHIYSCVYSTFKALPDKINFLIKTFKNPMITSSYNIFYTHKPVPL